LLQECPQLRPVPFVVAAAFIVVAAAAAQRGPTFAGDIAPILYANCTSCHRPGQAGPFSLLSYEDARTHGDEILEMTSARLMPPWHPTKAPGFPELRDERRLTDAQITTIRRWVDAGMPSGDLRRAPVPPVYPRSWRLGVPDLILTLPRPMPVPAGGPDLYRNVLISLDFMEDRWITAIDYQPSARQVVHHALFFAGPAGVIVRDDEAVPGLGRGLLARGAGATPGERLGGVDDAWSGLGGWVPGITPKFYPDGIAQPLPRNSNLVMQLHLHPSGTAAEEDGRVAIYFAKAPPQKSLTGVQVPPAFGFAMGLDIPAGESRYAIRDAFELPVDVEAFGARGHAHYLCREMKMTATLPDGSTRGLLWIGRWDFAWQDSYYFKTPIRLPKGTKITVDIAYDNSAANLANPNSPPVRVRWGRESTDEMGSMTLLIAMPAGPDQQTLRAAQAQHLRQQVLKNLLRK
jgi:mono/diheme cytochrome c family protein